MMLASKFPACLVWGPDLITIYNDAFKPILGAKPEALGRPFKEVWSEVWDEIGPIAERAMAGEATFIKHFPLMVERNGYPEEAFFTFCYSPVRDENGAIVGFLDTVVETTTEVKTRVALQADREHLHRLFQQAPSMVCILSGPEHVFELANPIYLEFIGHRDVIGRRLREAVPELEGQGFIAILDEVYATGQPFVGRQIPVTAQPQDGSPAKTRYFDFVYQPIRDEQGRITGIFAEGHDVTEQVRAQASLRESEARFRLFSEKTREGVVIHDGQTILDCNPAYARMFGYDDVQNVIGRSATDSVVPESAATIRAISQNGNEQPYEVEARRRDGSTFPAEFVSGDAEWQGQHVRIGLVRDLSTRKQREAELRASEARLSAVLESVTDSFFAVDAEWRLTVFNASAERFFGRSRETVLGRNIWEAFSHLVGTEVETSFRRVATEGRAQTLERPSTARPDRVVRISTTPKAGGGIAVTFSDITERKATEERLRASEARLEAVLRQSPVGIILAEAPSGKLILGNEQVAQILGYHFQPVSEVEAYGVYRGFDRSTGRQLQPGEWPLARSITTGEVVLNEEIDIERGDGSRGTVMANSTPIYDEQNRIVAGVVVFSDVTDRAVAERHQRLLINELNHRVKNTLATVQSLAAQSFRDIGDGSRSMLKTFEERLFALARAHDVLTREHWEGAELREIVEEVLEPYVRLAGKRFEIGGPRLRLTPSMALALAMAVHELATNAVKYGALSTASGRVLISWAVAERDPPLLILKWQEQDGPLVVPPTRKGFGTRLIERMLASELSGEVLLSYEPSGVVCEVKAPLQHEEQASGDRAVA
jgi:PAS domain S-box-containing protein